jgi:hypothetical protein
MSRALNTCTFAVASPEACCGVCTFHRGAVQCCNCESSYINAKTGAAISAQLEIVDAALRFIITQYSTLFSSCKMHYLSFRCWYGIRF